MDLTYRMVTDDDYEDIFLIRNQNIKDLHTNRLLEQKKGNLSYFVFYLDKEPVAMSLITFENSHAWHKYPAIEDLYVREEYRHKGLAKQILGILETSIHDRGCEKSCLDVELHEEWLIKFYEKIGYREISRPHKYTYLISGEEKTETVAYFEKEL